MGRAFPRILILGVGVLLVPACGGGGGGGGGGGASQLSSFTKTRGFDDLVLAVVVAPDGSGDVYVGGAFTLYNGTSSNGIVRLNSDGTIDAAFNVGTGFNSAVWAIVPVGDGSGDIYAGGSFGTYNGTTSFGLIRLNSDGTVDATLNVGAGFTSGVQTIAVAQDGSGDFYVGGTFFSYDGTSINRIIRLNSDGSIDTAFNVGVGFDDTVRTIATAGDGSGDVTVGGYFRFYNGTVANGIVRLNPDGTVDTGFNTGTGFDFRVHTIIEAADGSGDVYAGGSFTIYNGTPSSRIIRINSDGTVDAAFNIGTGFTSEVFVLARAVDGSGDIYAGGRFTSYNGGGGWAIIRINSDGSADAAFSVGSGFNLWVHGLAPAEDGSADVYVGGEFIAYDGIGTNRIVRLNSDGTVDAGFTLGAGFDADVRAIAQAADGSGDVYVGGDFAYYNGTSLRNLVRLNPDGTRDAAFDIGTGFGSFNTVYVILPSEDGSGDVYVGGDFGVYNGTSRNNLVRINSDGSLDAAFDIGTGFNVWVLALALSADGSGDVYAGGTFFNYNGTSSSRIIRLNSDGSIDTTFNIGSGFNTSVQAILPAQDGSGDVYCGGAFTSYNGTGANRIIRLNSDGTVDIGFNYGTGFDSSVKTLTPAGDGSGDIIVGGWFTTYDGGGSSHMVRLNPDGTVDGSFAIGTGFDNNVFAVSPAGDGSGDFYVGGTFTTYDSAAANRIVRLNPDGTVDAAFNYGAGFDADVLALSASGDVYAGGSFKFYGAAWVEKLAHVFSNGALD